MRRILLIVAALLLLPTPAAAHSGLHERIARVTAAIAERPEEAALYLDRAELNLSHEAFDAAAADIARARELEPELPLNDLLAGKLALARGLPTDALAPLGRFIAGSPRHIKARVLRAEAYLALHRPTDAVADLDTAIAATDAPAPRLFVDRATILVGLARYDDALRGIDRGIEQLGPLVVLVDAGIEAATRRGHPKLALAYLRRLPIKLRNSPTWQKTAGDLHAAAGDVDAARTMYRSARETLSKMPEARRRSPAAQTLSSEISAAFRRLDAPHETSDSTP